MSDVIHGCVVEALQFPQNKRAHRFIGLERADFFWPDGRTDAYTILEITMIAGRTVETKKRLIRLLFDRIRDEVGITHQDIEICILERPSDQSGLPRHAWRSVKLDYKIAV
ncbi:MAG: tautomerase family protein [Caldilineaceae bacterium]